MTTRKPRRILSLLVALVVIFSLSSVFCVQTAFAASDGSWRYTLEGNKATITGYTGSEKSITVPAKVNGYSVVAVSGLAGAGLKPKVTGIIFSEGIQEIYPALCTGYKSLKSVSLPSTLTTIGSTAFSGCPALTGIVIPYNVSSIGISAFSSCTSLISASVNCKVSELPTGIFADCNKLASVTLPSNTLKKIGSSAFSNCTNLSSIAFPDTVTDIGNSAFSNCTSLKGTLTLPISVVNVGSEAFSNCSGITTVVIPNKTRKIDSSAFSHCTSLKYAYIGNSIDKIGSNIFFGCTELEKVVFGGSYIKFSNIFDLSSVPTVYYPLKYKSKWNNYTGDKKSYNSTTKITISNNKTITEGNKLALKVTTTPNTSSVGNLCYFSSSNTAVATVDDKGVVTGKAGGSAVITATTINGTTKSVTVQVTPSKATGVKAVPATTSSINITWNAKDNVTGYIVYRSTNKTSGYKKIGTSLTNSYTDKGLTKGTTYYYAVRAYVKVNSKTYQSALSSPATATATSPAPSNVSAKKYTAGKATIQWTKCIGASGYQLAISTSANGTYKSVYVATSGSSLAFRKTGLTPGKTYYFKVRSYTIVNGKKVYSNFTNPVQVRV